MSAATKPHRDLLSEHRRAEILDAARIVFARQGYGETVVEDVAKEAHVAKGTLYLYFRSKEEIYLAALMLDIERLGEQTRRRMDGAGTFADKLRVFLSTRLEYVETNQNFLRIYLAEFGSLFVRAKPIPHELEALFWRNCHLLAGVIEHAVQTGEIRSVPAEPTAFAIQDLARGLFERRLLGWSKMQPHEDLEFTYNLIYRALRGE